ncbi:hypothetical protein [Paracoccus aeridis]|uniref:hypothetical protein n=1 Tax=Paracoccus aeridis TaxID=1966466 RepID=UPI0010AAB172|nr:hypothetical protein [Paracoccus aeridis]
MFAVRTAALILAATAAVAPVTAAHSAVEARGELPAVKAWSAVAGMSARQVVDLAGTLPTGSADAGTPWCDASAQIHGALDAEFGETLVLAKRDGLRLWGSDEMGTWTMVFERPDGSSCIVASGIGYQDGTDPSVIFRTAGLPG